MPHVITSARTQAHERADVPVDLLDGYITFSDLDGMTLHVGLPEDLREGDVVMLSGRIPAFRRLIGEPRTERYAARFITWQTARTGGHVMGEHTYLATAPVIFFRTVPQ